MPLDYLRAQDATILTPTQQHGEDVVAGQNHIPRNARPRNAAICSRVTLSLGQ
jgi:hypothetical protein